MGFRSRSRPSDRARDHLPEQQRCRPRAVRIVGRNQRGGSGRQGSLRGHGRRRRRSLSTVAACTEAACATVSRSFPGNGDQAIDALHSKNSVLRVPAKSLRKCVVTVRPECCPGRNVPAVCGFRSRPRPIRSAPALISRTAARRPRAVAASSVATSAEALATAMSSRVPWSSRARKSSSRRPSSSAHAKALRRPARPWEALPSRAQPAAAAAANHSVASRRQDQLAQP